MHALVSTHVVLEVHSGEFVSLMDPPETLRTAAAACNNVGVWPVLVGAAGEATTLLASPIILYDYPQIAPESPGDLFDGTEIDELLSLRIMTLTDEEKQAAGSIDERTRRMMQRTESLAREQLASLHGAVRGLAASPHAAAPTASTEGKETANAWQPPDIPRAPQSVRVGGRLLRPGDKVRLRPAAGADIFDLALDGMAATIESIEQDFEDRVYLAVTVDDDPGQDFGRQRQPGHRFFFKVEEVELLY